MIAEMCNYICNTFTDIFTTVRKKRLYPTLKNITVIEIKK